MYLFKYHMALGRLNGCVKEEDDEELKKEKNFSVSFIDSKCDQE